MNRLAPALLLPVFLAAGGGTALAATPMAPVNPSPAGAQSAQAAARMTRALNMLEANGYGDFSNFKPAGKDFDAMVTRDGRHFAVTVDPDTGKISRQG